MAKAKGEMIEALSADGTAILNLDDERVAAMRRLTSARILSYGFSASADVSCADRIVGDDGRVSMSVVTPWGSTKVQVPVPGLHMAHNVLAAIAIAGVCGVDVGAAATGIESASVSPMRMESLVTATGARILSDCYNANPASMRAALETLAALPATRRVAVLGLMAELADAPREHAAIAEFARSRGVEIIAVSTDAYGVAPVSIEEAAEALNSLGGDGVGLVKGSRVAALERVVSALRRG